MRGLPPNPARRKWCLKTLQGVSLHLKVRLDIPVGRDRLLVAHPQCNHFECNTGLEQVKCGRVSKTVQSDFVLLQGRTTPSRAVHGLLQTQRCASTRQRHAISTGENILIGPDLILRAPGSDLLLNLRPYLRRLGKISPVLLVKISPDGLRNCAQGRGVNGPGYEGGEAPASPPEVFRWRTDSAAGVGLGREA